MPPDPPSLCVRGVQYVIYSTRGVVEWLIKHEAKPSAYQPQPKDPAVRIEVPFDWLMFQGGLKNVTRYEKRDRSG